MRLPIGYALAWPARLPVPFGAITWTDAARLDFEAPDLESFPCLGLAYDAGRAGGSAPTWLNAANEVAVAAFLEGGLRWLDIAEVIQESLQGHHGGEPGRSATSSRPTGRLREQARAVVERRHRAA